MTQIYRAPLVAFPRFLRGLSVPSRRGLAAFGIAVLVLWAAPVFAQRPEPAGFPIDWSNSHVVYPPGVSMEQVWKIERDPRYLRQKHVREHSAEIADRASASRELSSPKKKKPGAPLTVDWAVSLGTGALAQSMYPAKYSFATGGTPSCSDWVVYGLNATPAANQATLMAVNNLYGTANGCTANPGVIFAYKTVGAIITSPVISYFDGGLQVAFVDNEGGKATLHVVKYSTATGNGTAAGAPVASPGTGSEVTPLQYSTTTNTNSPVYVDFSSDTAYVGDDGGKLYKIHPVFEGGNPLTTATATLAGKLTGPVLDELNGVVLVGSNNGDLYARNAVTLAAVGTPLAVGDGSTYGGIVDPPVIVAGSTTYAFTTTDCNGSLGILEEDSETPSALTHLASPTIADAHGCGSNNLHAPALDDNVYNGSAGYVYVCGTVIRSTQGPGGTEAPVLYSYSFDPSNGALGSSPAHTLSASSTSTDECSPLSYFTGNSTSKIFFGVGTGASTGSINSSTVTGAGAIGALTTVASPGGLGGTSAIIVDNSSATSSLANVYFSGLQAGNVTGGSCQSFTVNGSNIGTTVTLTGTNLNFKVGSTIVVSGFTGTPAFYDGTFTVASVTGTTSLTYTDTAATSNTSQNTHTASWGTCGFQLTQSALN